MPTLRPRDARTIRRDRIRAAIASKLRRTNVPACAPHRGNTFTTSHVTSDAPRNVSEPISA